MIGRKKIFVQVWRQNGWFESEEPRFIEASKLCQNPNCNRILPSRKATYWAILAKSLKHKDTGYLQKGKYCSPTCKKVKNKAGLYQFSIGGPCAECGGLGAIEMQGKKLCWDCYESK